MILALVQAMRPHQWVKNLLVLAPLVFAYDEVGSSKLLLAIQAFAIFCLLSSSVYLINDIADREADRQHPRKKNRPIASGRLPVQVAVVAFVACSIGGVFWAYVLGEGDNPTLPFVAWPFGYFVMNTAYSFWLKRIPIVDCLTIALGFLFRVHAGSVAIGVESSDWILLCTFFFALFLAFCKRRDEVVNVSDGSGKTRAVMRYYTQEYLDQLMPPLAALSILSYALYTVAPATIERHNGRDLLLTVPIVVYGVFRYLFLVHVRGKGGEPSRDLFTDRSLLVSGVLYMGLVWLALQPGRIL